MPFITKKCAQCGKRAESTKEFSIGEKTVLLLKCGHIVSKDQLSAVSGPEELESLDGKKLYPFQVDGVNFALKSGGRVAILDEMGLGKTMQGLGTVFCGGLWPFLVITKSTLTTQWSHAVINWMGPEFVPLVISSAREKLFPGLRGYIISFDLIRRFNGSLVEQLATAGIKTIIIDECQAIKNPASQRTAEVRELCKAVDNVICLSGTPIKNNAAEYFPVLNILQPEMFPVYNKFVAYECDSYKSGFGWKVGGLRYPDRFKDKTKNFIIRRERTEVLPDLPVISRNFQFCDLSKEVEKAYQDTFKQFRDDYNAMGAKHSLVEESNILAYLSKMRHLTGLSKIDPAVDFTMEFLGGTDRKLTIFVHHKDVASILLNKLTSLCKELELPDPLSLSSDMSIDARAECVDKFMETDARILIASTLASGEGLNLQKCSDCIMLERQWNPSNEEQAEGRFIRIGQAADKVSATYFVAVGTVDEFFAEIVERKREIVSKTLGGQAAKWDQSSIMSELSEVLASQGGKRWNI